MQETKRQNLPIARESAGILNVVATPLGNLSDLSERAKESLQTADAVLCEDTRRTAKLMAALGLSKRLERFDAHSGDSRVRELVERLENGERMALVSDAGTPGVSDPGAALVLEASRSERITISPIPGPSAVTALLSVSGFQDSSFGFLGFFPRKTGERKNLIESLRSRGAPRIWVWFESPERITTALEDLSGVAPEARVVAGKELTKVYERFFRGSSLEVFSQVREEIEREGALGEWCFAVCFESPQKAESDESVFDQAPEKALQCLNLGGVSASESVKIVSQVFGVPKKSIYELSLKIFGKK